MFVCGGREAVVDLDIGLCFREPAFAIVAWRLGWRRDWMPVTLWQYSR